VEALELFARILFAALVGAAIGLERELRGRAAGLRTHILVCAGAALVMVLAGELGHPDGPGRALAGIVTGVGFLGAGAIVRTRDIVRGVTTAACIWLVAVLGAAAGQGLYILAAGSAALTLLVLLGLNRVERLVPAHSYHTVIVHAQGTEVQRLDELCRGVFSGARQRVLALDVRLDRSKDCASLTFYVRSRGEVRSAQLSEELLTLPGVSRVSWQ
jgi:putative Mg2+ transporter-C (MgtC) family protein